MAAADPSQCVRVVSSPLVPSLEHSERSPQVRALTVLSCPPRLLPRRLVARVSLWLASSPRRESLPSAVRAPRAVSLPAGFLQTSPRDDALALGYRRGDRPRKGLSPPSQRPCWAHKARGERLRLPPSHTRVAHDSGFPRYDASGFGFNVGAGSGASGRGGSDFSPGVASAAGASAGSASSGTPAITFSI